MSKRVVWPYAFTLRVCELVEAYRSGATHRLETLEPLRPQAEGAQFGIPTALRWLTLPELGIPRRPFQVYRRLRGRIPSAYVRELFAATIAATGPTLDLAFPAGSGGLVYLAGVTLAPAGGEEMSVTAYDLYGRDLPGQQYTTASPATTLLTGPGMAGLRVTGIGTVGPVLGVKQDDYANLPDWQLTQVVGLPTLAGELAPHYASQEHQGYVTPTLSGYQAAELRLLIAEILRGMPAPTNDPQFPLAAWPASAPVGYLDTLRSPGNLLAAIGNCLAASIDTDPARMQSLYAEPVSLEGIKQANMPGASADPSRPSAAEIPVVSVTMLGVSTDSDAATALGYGTVDFPGLGARSEVAAEPATAFEERFLTFDPLVYDFMVSAPYALPLLGVELNLAALSQMAPPVKPPAGLAAKFSQMHAVLSRDSTAQVAVELSWQPAAEPQGCALLASRQPFSSTVLNAPRQPAVGGYDPYVGLPPASPDPGLPADEQLPNFKDAAGQLPLDGTATTRYLAAAIDVFGRFSAWSEADVSLSAAPIAQPGLRDLSFVLGDLPDSGMSVSSELVIEVMWDWTDRSPGAIRITGEFVASSASLGPAYLSGLAMSNAGAVGAPLLLVWDYGGANPATVAPDSVLPTIDSGHTGTVELITDASGASAGEVMQYRVTLQGVTLDFSAERELALAVYVTATESIRAGEWSNPQMPGAPGFTGQIVRALNPFPPALEFTPPAIDWTALPDAYNRARGILEWTSDPSAAGYMVWESTEGALLQLLSPGSPNPDPTASLVARGAALKALVAGEYEGSLQSFSRLNTDPIVGSRTEIELPGDASALYAYMVSAVSPQGVEAPRAPQIAVFGVPRRMVPGQPRLILRELPIGSSGIQVIGLPVETGVTPAGYRVLRVRSQALAGEAGLMGPAKIAESDPGWTPYTDVPLHGGTTSSGQSVIDTAATASWYPYYYRIVAVGPDDPANGEHSGDSPPSAVQFAYCLPPEAPALAAGSPAFGSGAALLVASIDLPIPPSPLASSLVELLHAEPDPAHAGRTRQRTVIARAPESIAEGALQLPSHFHLPPWGPPHPPSVGPALARSAVNPDGSWSLYVLVPYGATDASTYTVRLTDPLKRQSTTTF